MRSARGRRAAGLGVGLNPGGAGRGGKTGSLDHQELVRGSAERGVMMEPSPAAALIMPQSQFLLELFVVPLDDPTVSGEPHQRGQFGLRR